MRVCKASQSWGYACCVSISKCKLALIFIIAFSSSQLHGAGVKYSGERVPDDAKSLQILQYCIIHVYYKCLHENLLMAPWKYFMSLPSYIFLEQEVYIRIQKIILSKRGLDTLALFSFNSIFDVLRLEQQLELKN